jgi:hypothetical protein
MSLASGGVVSEDLRKLRDFEEGVRSSFDKTAPVLTARIELISQCHRDCTAASMSAFAGDRWPPDVIVTAVRRYYRRARGLPSLCFLLNAVNNVLNGDKG